MFVTVLHIQASQDVKADVERPPECCVVWMMSMDSERSRVGMESGGGWTVGGWKSVKDQLWVMWLIGRCLFKESNQLGGGQTFTLFPQYCCILLFSSVFSCSQSTVAPLSRLSFTRLHRPAVLSVILLSWGFFFYSFIFSFFLFYCWLR